MGPVLVTNFLSPSTFLNVWEGHHQWMAVYLIAISMSLRHQNLMAQTLIHEECNRKNIFPDSLTYIGMRERETWWWEQGNNRPLKKDKLKSNNYQLQHYFFFLLYSKLHLLLLSLLHFPSLIFQFGSQQQLRILSLSWTKMKERERGNEESTSSFQK